MRRLLRLTGLTLAAAALLILVGGAARGQVGEDVEEEVEGDAWATDCGEVTGVCVHAAERRSLQPVETPDRNRPPTVVCVWYPFGDQSGGWDDPEGVVPAPYLVVGDPYTVDCHRVSDGGRVTGYPSNFVYRGGGTVPGEAVSGWEVSQYAVGRLGLEAPVAAVSPPTRQMVGVETWLAVTSRLRGYSERSAQAGSVWATVRAFFADATWDLGPHGRLTCTADAARTWNPALSGDRQRSDCTIVFDTGSGPRGLNATVTVRWRIYWLSSEHVGWRRHDDYSLRAIVPLDVREMQAAIR